MVIDHRDLNRDMEVFTTDPRAGSGLQMRLPAARHIHDGAPAPSGSATGPALHGRSSQH